MNGIVTTFDAAADQYGKYSRVQQKIARQLFTLIDKHLATPRQILEIGCGTGNLTELLVNKFSDSSILVIDGSERMLDALRSNLASDRLQLQLNVIDGEDFFGEEIDCDLVASNMALQWIDNLDRFLEGCLSSKFSIAFSIPVVGTFENWIAAHERLGLRAGVREFMEVAELESWMGRFSDGLETRLEIQDFKCFYSHPIEFVRTLKRVGAGTPRPNHSPVSLQRVFGEFEDGIEVTYRIAFVIVGARSNA